MKTSVQARLDEETQAALEQVVSVTAGARPKLFAKDCGSLFVSQAPARQEE